MFNRHFWMSGAAGIALLALSGASSAQQEARDADVITVLGEKIERSLQDTPTSVAVTTAERIEEENIRNLFDVVTRTANVTETYGSTGFTIRGVSNNSVSGGGNGGLASIYVDGVAVPQGISVASGPFTMWDVQQVEILRGPQSTLQGRNALAGAIIVQSRTPTWEWDGRLRASVSDGDETSLAFAGGGPIVDDQLAFRIAVEGQEADGFTWNPTRGTDEDPLSLLTARGSLLFEPDALPDLSVRLSYMRYDQESGYAYSYARTDTPDAFDNRINTSNDPNAIDSTTDMVTLDFDYAIDDRLTLTGLTAWSLVDDYFEYDGDLGPVSESYGHNARETETFSQEIRLHYAGDRLEGLVGVYISDRDVDATSASLTLVTTPEATLNAVLQGPPFGLDAATAAAASSLYVAALPVIPVSYTADAPSQIETEAIFADGSFKLTPRLTLLGGFRYDRENYTLTSVQTASFAGTYPDPALYGPYAPVVSGLNLVVESFVTQASASAPTDNREFEAFLPKLGATWDWTDMLSTSVIVQRGYRSGGSQVNVARSNVVPYDPEYTWNYEFALRSAWLDGDLIVNANAYYVDWTDQQVSVNLGLNAYDYQTENAGESHLYGFEIELAHTVSSAFDWYASLGHTRTEFDDFIVQSGGTFEDLSGTEFAFAPRWTATVGGTYEWANGLFANMNASYRTEAYSTTGTDQDQTELGARAIVNGKFGYEADSWGAFLFANNIFDEDYYQYLRNDMPYAIFGDPRVVGVMFEADW